MILFFVATFVALAFGSSHSEAPGTAKSPRSDLSDVYAFKNAAGKLVLIMNISPLQQSQAGPNYSPVDNNFVYQMHIDNDGDAKEDKTFQFLFGSRFGGADGQGIAIDVNGKSIKIPLSHASGITAGDEGLLNVQEYYRVRLLEGDDYSTLLEDGPFLKHGAATEFRKPFEYAGTKTFAAADGKTSEEVYAEYADQFVFSNVDIPGCDASGKLFVGSRRDSFILPLGNVFDLLNTGGLPINGVTDPANKGADPERGQSAGSLDRFGVTSIVLEVDPSCVTASHTDNEILGVWASVRDLHHVEAVTNNGWRKRAVEGDDDDDSSSSSGSSSSSSSSSSSGSDSTEYQLVYVLATPEDDKADTVEAHMVGDQVSRLGNPLVNELFIGLTDKDTYSTSHPSDDVQFLDYFTNPTLPTIIDIVYQQELAAAGFADGVAPAIKRDDVVAALLQGIEGINKPPNDAPVTAATPAAPHKTYKIIDGDHHHHHHKRQATEVFADVLRINLATANFKSESEQNCLGVIGGDTAGFPNGRRLGDDVVDIFLAVAEGRLCHVPLGFCDEADAPAGSIDFFDGVPTTACFFQTEFPYLNIPVPGDMEFSAGVASQFDNAINTCPTV